MDLSVQIRLHIENSVIHVHLSLRNPVLDHIRIFGALPENRNLRKQVSVGNRSCKNYAHNSLGISTLNGLLTTYFGQENL